MTKQPVENVHNIMRSFRRLPPSIKKVPKFAFDWLGVSGHVELLTDSALRDRGWFGTFHEAPKDSDGNPIPWMPYSFIDFLSDRIDSSFRVFEYGSGFSTMWYANQVDELITVEHNRNWYEQVNSKLPENAEIFNLSGQEYINSISKNGKFDLVVIDGKHRSESVEIAVEHLSKDGVIIWDDTVNVGQSNGYAALMEADFNEIFFQGMGPVTTNLQRTSVFYRDNNCLDI